MHSAAAGRGTWGWYYPYAADSIPDYVCVPHAVSVDMPCGGCRWQCTRSAEGLFPCVEAVTAEAVAAELRNLLAK